MKPRLCKERGCVGSDGEGLELQSESPSSKERGWECRRKGGGTSVMVLDSTHGLSLKSSCCSTRAVEPEHCIISCVGGPRKRECFSDAPSLAQRLGIPAGHLVVVFIHALVHPPGQDGLGCWQQPAARPHLR